MPLREACICSREGFDVDCPWAREGIGHVLACPETGDPCPCAEGSTSYAHCAANAARSVRDHPDQWRLGGALIWQHARDPRRRVADQLVELIRLESR